MNLEVGMYVRTKKGIYKINYFINNAYTQKFTYIDNLGVSNILEKNEVVKASYNIIDLIEVGDYVNGYRVDFIENIDSPILKIQKVFCEEYEKDLYSKSFNVKNIKSIVTKEQFESMSYKVGD